MKNNDILILKCSLSWPTKINDYVMNNILAIKAAAFLFLLAIIDADSITAEAGTEKVDEGEYDYSKSFKGDY